MKIKNAADFGQIIRKRRRELGYTQEFVAEFTGVSVTYISQLERGKKTAEIEKAIMLANVLGLDLFLIFLLSTNIIVHLLQCFLTLHDFV